MNPIRMSRIEAAVRTLLKFCEAFNRHDVDGMMSLVGDDCILESAEPAPDGMVYAGKEAIVQRWRDFLRESPEAHLEVEEIFGLGERCVLRWKYTWTATGGEEKHIRGIDVFRVSNGCIRRQLAYIKSKMGEGQ